MGICCGLGPPGTSLPGFIPVTCQQRPHFCLILYMGKMRLIAGDAQGQAAGVVKRSKPRGRTGLCPALLGPALLGRPSAGLGPVAHLDGQAGAPAALFSSGNSSSWGPSFFPTWRLVGEPLAAPSAVAWEPSLPLPHSACDLPGGPALLPAWGARAGSHGPGAL